MEIHSVFRNAAFGLLLINAIFVGFPDRYCEALT